MFRDNNNAPIHRSAVCVCVCVCAPPSSIRGKQENGRLLLLIKAAFLHLQQTKDARFVLREMRDPLPMLYACMYLFSRTHRRNILPGGDFRGRQCRRWFFPKRFEARSKQNVLAVKLLPLV